MGCAVQIYDWLLRQRCFFFVPFLTYHSFIGLTACNVHVHVHAHNVQLYIYQVETLALWFVQVEHVTWLELRQLGCLWFQISPESAPKMKLKAALCCMLSFWCLYGLNKKCHYQKCHYVDIGNLESESSSHVCTSLYTFFLPLCVSLWCVVVGWNHQLTIREGMREEGERKRDRAEKEGEGGVCCGT